MKSRTILFFSLLYFFIYLVFSLAIDQYFVLETSLPALIGIGFVFDILLIVLLVFDVPDKIADKLSRKEERVLFCIADDSKDDEDTAELLKTLEENATKIESVDKKSEGKIIELEIVEKSSEQKEENIY